jgi:biopolymer transport protein ExbB/TolQ
MVIKMAAEIISNILHAISQSLLYPVIIGLLLFMVYAIITLGSLIYEYYHRNKINVKQIEGMVLSISNPGTPNKITQVVEASELPRSHKDNIINLAKSSKIGPASQEALAKKLIENEEIRVAKKLEKTDIVTRLGPTLGLMGTLIPMGPGLAALGSGDIQQLANAIIIAFDTTVVGLAAGGVAYVISKIRRRWYEEDLSNLETLMESVLEVLKNAPKT